MLKRLIVLISIFFLFFLSANAALAFQFVSWADTKNARSVLSELSDQVAVLNPVFTIYPGDLEDSGFTQSGMDAWKNAINGMLTGSTASNGVFDKTFPVRGNHDGSNASGWQGYYNLSATAARVGATNYSELAEDLTYSFDYGNSHFIGVDVPGDVTKMTSAQISWIDGDLTAAEKRGLTHAFLYWHGPIYALDGHCCPTAPAALITVLNKHPIVTATFHGHEHVYTYTHINNSRIPGVTHEFEEFITGAAGAGPSSVQSGRYEYWMNAHGFITVDIEGPKMTVNWYKRGSSAVQNTLTFTKGTSGGTPPPSTDSAPPSIPANLKASVISSSQINLSWNASTDNVGVVGYKIYRNGSVKSTSVGTSFQDTGLSAATTYTYRVSAFDLAGNESSQSTAVSATTLSVAPPPPAPSPTFGPDLNNDGKVDIQDIGIMLSYWGNITKPRSDLNQDGKVDIIDLGILLSAWGGGVQSTSGSASTSTSPPSSTSEPSAPPPPSTVSKGIWISPAEIAALPMSGTAWNNLKKAADSSPGDTSLTTRNTANVITLAKALVYARTGTSKYRDEVINIITGIIGTENGDDLAVFRRLEAYVVAADLVGLPSDKDSVFRAWLKQMLTKQLGSWSVTSNHETRPNNWGLHAGASRAAIAAYLGDRAELDRTAKVFKGWLGDRASYAGFKYGDLSWQCDSSNPVGVNPKDCTKQGHNIDGVLPDDQRRCGGFQWPPCKTNYAWGGLQGALSQAVILYRAGYDVWNWENKALFRAVQWLYNTTFSDGKNYPAEGDDTWQPWIVNYYYGTNFPASTPTQPGKNTGWTDWTHQ